MGIGQHLCDGKNLEAGMTARELAAEPERPSHISIDIVLLAGFCGFLFFFGLGYFGLIGADEPRYAQVAREMLRRHDWITPTLWNKPWLEKPPLYYWQAILAYRAFGVSDWAARLPSAVDATLMVVAVYLFLLRFRRGFHLDGALITASSAGIVGFARAASTDMPLAAMFTIAMLAWYAWYESRSKAYLALFYFFLALGALAKGPIALLLAALIIFFFAALKHDFALAWKTLWIPGIALFCLAALPWYVAVQIRNPGFFRIFILQHNLARFGTNLYHHIEPFWYFVPVILIGLLPWTFFVLAKLWEIFRVWKDRKSQTEHAFDTFLAIWLIVPIIFFSLSQSKLPGYILPALPAGCLLVVEYVRRRCARNASPRLWQIVVHSIVASFLLVPALMIQYILLQHRLPRGSVLIVPLGFAGMIVAGIALSLKMFGLRVLRTATLVPVVLAVAIVLRVGSPVLDRTLSSRILASDLSQFKAKLRSPHEPLQVAVFEASRETEYGLGFYLDGPISRYENHQIPNSVHIVVAPAGSQTVVAKAVAGRRVSYLGTFAPRGLDYFWVSAKAASGF